MWTESEIQNCKKIFLEEVGCNDKAEKVFDETFERVRNLDFSEFHDREDMIDKMSEILEMPAKNKAFFKDNIDNNKVDTSPEEFFRDGVRLGKEFLRIKETQH